MNTADSRALNRGWYWVALVPLVCLAARALIKYMWWAAMHSALYGVASETRRLQQADSNISFYLWSMFIFAIIASGVTTLALSPASEDSHLHQLKGIGRFVVAVVLVTALIAVVAAAMSMTGFFLR